MLTLANNLNFSSSFYQIKETRYVFVAHTDTTMTSRLTNQVLFIGAMDIDKAFPSVLFVGFYAIQPKNAGSVELTFFIPVGRIGDRYEPSEDGLQRPDAFL